MNKQLIDLQRNSKATCAIIKTEDFSQLSPSVLVEAKTSDESLFADRKPMFADKLDIKCHVLKQISYLVVTEIDTVPLETQERFVGLVKDREINDYVLPDNCIIVFTVKNERALKKVSPELYHFAVVAF